MALVFNKNMNFNGYSTIEGVLDEFGNKKVILLMNASYNQDNKVYFSKNIEDILLYEENKEVCEADYAEFEAKVLATIGTDVEVVDIKA